MIFEICKRGRERGENSSIGRKSKREKKRKREKIGNRKWKLETLTLDLVESENCSFAQLTLNWKVKRDGNWMEAEEKENRVR